MISQRSQRSFFLSVILSAVLIIAGCSAPGPKRVDGELVFDSDSLVKMADTFAQTGDYGNALRLYQRASTENPEHLAARLGLARTYRILGAADASIKVYQDVLTLAPLNEEAKLGISQMLIRKNKPDEALDYLSQINGAMAQDYRYFNIRGLAYDLKGDHEQAQMTYGMGLNSEPENVSLLNNLGLSFAIQGQYAPAIRILSKAANLDVNNKTALENLTMAYTLSGEEQAAREMAATFMSDEEIPVNFHFYHWLSELTSKERAQAIFLGIKEFPKEELAATTSDESGVAQESSEEPLDPKKQKLLEILNAQEQEEVGSMAAEPAPAPATTPDVTANGPVEQEVNPVASGGDIADTVPEEKIYRVQLGSYPTEDQALTGWDWLMKKSGDLLSAYSPLAQEAVLPDGATLFRLFVSEIEGRQEGRDLCASLKDQGVDCLVIYTHR